jgi:peroxiredoxin
MPKTTHFFTLIFGLFLLASACSSEQSNSNNQQTAEADVREAPAFEVTTIEGDTVSLQKSMDNNKPLVVYFTASWCPICAKNWPVLSKLYPEYEDRLDLVAIGIDPTDDEETMRNLSEEEGFTFPITKGHPEIMRNFGVEAQATTVGVNTDGTIAFQKNKTALSEEEYRELFDQLLN